MIRRIMLVPAGENVGLTTVTLGLLRAFQQQAIDVNFFKPVAQTRKGQTDDDHSNEIVRNVSELSTANPLSQAHVEHLIGDYKMDVLLEEIISNFEQHYSKSNAVIIEGLVADPRKPYTVRLNRLISNALNAKLILVMNPDSQTNTEINDQLEISTYNYGGHDKQRLLGCIFNKINAPMDEKGRIQLNLNDSRTDDEGADSVVQELQKLPIFSREFSFLGAVTWSAELNAPRVIDLCRHMNAEVLNGLDELDRRITSVHFCARELYYMMPAIRPGALLVVSADRADLIVAICLAALNGTRIGALLLTGDYSPSERLMDLCKQAMATGLPILKINGNTWSTAIALQTFNEEVPVDDVARISAVMDHTASCIDENWVRSLTEGVQAASRLSPPAFRYKLSSLAREANKTIVLPEGNEPRTIAAAAICVERKIANCVLIGDEEEIRLIAANQRITLPEDLKIINPMNVREDYVAPMVELRKHKGITEVIAQEQLRDNNVLGTMMLKQGDVDGLVSGAVNTTAATIRPALQLIKTAPDASLVSSVFFMLLPDQVLVYGDCAINPDPDANALAEIAIQSADSAAAFGIEPRVAMISYSTGDSGTGADVDKVKAATKITKEKRPDLIIDGPLQYDAAVMESVAKKKAPNSPVAGQATVLVFPDLNTGNTTYKAVQRSADLVSIGPMLQGLNKPVNDLSRGALVDDIVYTIALTAIQATQR